MVQKAPEKQGAGAVYNAPRAPHMPEGRPDQGPDRKPLGRDLPEQKAYGAGSRLRATAHIRVRVPDRGGAGEAYRGGLTHAAHQGPTRPRQGNSSREMGAGMPRLHLCIRRPRVAGLSRILLPTDSRSMVPYLNIMLSLPLLIV